MPRHILELDDHSVTVPAHGTATVEVDARGDVGEFCSTRRTARSAAGSWPRGRVGHDRVRVTTAVGMYLEPEMVDVKAGPIDRNGDPVYFFGDLDITDLHQPTRALYLLASGEITLRPRAGNHFIMSRSSGPPRTTGPSPTPISSTRIGGSRTTRRWSSTPATPDR